MKSRLKLFRKSLLLAMLLVPAMGLAAENFGETPSGLRPCDILYTAKSDADAHSSGRGTGLNAPRTNGSPTGKRESSGLN
jgi:hypothetical protein